MQGFIKSCISFPFYTIVEHETICLIGTAFVFMSEPLSCPPIREKWRDKTEWRQVVIKGESVSRMTAAMSKCRCAEMV